MDWIDEKIYKIKELIVNATLRKSLCFYIVLLSLCVIILTLFTLNLCGRWGYLIWSKYSEVNQANILESGIQYNYADYSKLTSNDFIFIKVIDFVQAWCVFLYSIIGIISTSYLFYRNKLKEPLRILEEGSEKISNNDLDFNIQYNRTDELGNLCNSFELMRKQLISNNQKMWDLMAEQKQLNAAFAHDLRTPLTVLRGYTDFLTEYIPQNKISEEKLISTLSLMSTHIERLGHYSNTMKEINSLENFPFNPSPLSVLSFQTKMAEIIHILDGTNGISVNLVDTIAHPITFLLDEHLAIEVFENILSNALRYAKSTVEVSLEVDSDATSMRIYVSDDGDGFTSNGISKALTPYYTDTTQEHSQHFGIGLYICKVLCEKHRGTISLSNSIQKGAIVTATFGS